MFISSWYCYSCDVGGRGQGWRQIIQPPKGTDELWYNFEAVTPSSWSTIWSKALTTLHRPASVSCRMVSLPVRCLNPRVCVTLSGTLSINVAENSVYSLSEINNVFVLNDLHNDVPWNNKLKQQILKLYLTFCHVEVYYLAMSPLQLQSSPHCVRAAGSFSVQTWRSLPTFNKNRIL